MDNKDEKTFTDLFSSFKEEPETKTQTFSNILNNDTNKENSSKDITFDSLFDQISSKENEKSNSLVEEQIKNNTPKERIEEPLLETQEKIVLEDKKEKEIIFDDDNNIELETKESAISDSKEVSDNLDNKQINLNPFMNEDITEEPNSIVVENKEVLSTPSVEVSPFFEETTIQDNINESSSKENNIDNNINPFMNEDIFNEENNTIVENKIKISIPTVEINAISKENEKKEEKESKIVETKSTSPFFEEEKKTEENPFFQNQLNLVENKVPNTPKGTIDSSKSKHYNVKIVKKKEPLIKLILGILSYALFIWLLLIGVTLLVYVLDIRIRAAKGDYSSPTFNAYVVLTGSMLPEIEVYDVVVTKKVDAEKLKEGDVITFASVDTRFLDTIITHRIIKKNPPSDTEGYTFQTKGDNNNVADSALVPENRIFGKVILKIPKLGYLQDFLASKGGWIIVILIPCLTVISYDTVKLIKGLKRKKYKNIKVQK